MFNKGFFVWGGWFVVFENFHGVNTPTKADFQLSTI